MPMSLLTRLLPSFLTPSGHQQPTLSVLDILASKRRRTEPQLPPPTSFGKMRIHLFAGGFASEDAARHYCYYTENNRPEDLTRELPDAYIDTAHVEVCYNDALNRLSSFLLPADASAMHAKMGDKNTLVIIAEPAFAGLAYALNDTARLTYLGPLVVRV